MRLHLKDVVVQRLQQTGIYYDTTTPAFGIRVGKNRKTWVVTRGEKRERISIGRYPEVSLADARKKAKQLLLEPKTKTDSRTFDEAFEEYSATLETKKPRTRKEYKRLLTKHFKPILRNPKYEYFRYKGVRVKQYIGRAGDANYGDFLSRSKEMCRRFDSGLSADQVFAV